MMDKTAILLNIFTFLNLCLCAVLLYKNKRNIELIRERNEYEWRWRREKSKVSDSLATHRVSYLSEDAKFSYDIYTRYWVSDTAPLINAIKENKISEISELEDVYATLVYRQSNDDPYVYILDKLFLGKKEIHIQFPYASGIDINTLKGRVTTRR